METEDVMQKLLTRLFNGPAWLTFLAMGVFAGLFALTSFNLLELFMANFQFVTAYGVMALREGGIVQALELIVYGYLSLGFYVLFKGCLYGLLGRFQKH